MKNSDHYTKERTKKREASFLRKTVEGVRVRAMQKRGGGGKVHKDVGLVRLKTWRRKN